MSDTSRPTPTIDRAVRNALLRRLAHIVVNRREYWDRLPDRVRAGMTRAIFAAYTDLVDVGCRAEAQRVLEGIEARPDLPGPGDLERRR